MGKYKGKVGKGNEKHDIRNEETEMKVVLTKPVIVLTVGYVALTACAWAHLRVPRGKWAASTIFIWPA